jgi:hypothetical protein
LPPSADAGYYFREVEIVREPEQEGAASDSDESENAEEPSECEVGHVRGNTAAAGKSAQSPDPELDGEVDNNDTNPFEDMLDYAPNDQVRSLLINLMELNIL